ncbi:MAG: hypothetical protein JWQ64_992 [Subtercola sp.]|nr:hypothetical protein [Subtercola sp.]
MAASESPTSPATRIGIVGLGKHTFHTYYNSLRWAPDHDVVTAVDIDPEKIAQFTKLYAIPRTYTDYNEAFEKENLDAVLIQVGHKGNFPIIRAALEAGIHVFVEKTPVLNTAEADELIAVQKRTGAFVMVGWNRRFTTSYLMAKEIIGREEFGGVRAYQSQFHATPYDEDAFKINHIIHHFDMARWLLGEITLTHAQHVSFGDRLHAYTISFRSENGAIGTIQAASMLDELYPMERLELVGDRRNIVIDNVKGLVYNRPPVRKEAFEPFALEDTSDALVWNQSHGYYPRFTNHGYENELHYFVSSIRAGVEPQPTLEDSRRSLALVEDLDRLLGVASPRPIVSAE